MSEKLSERLARRFRRRKREIHCHKDGSKNEMHYHENGRLWVAKYKDVNGRGCGQVWREDGSLDAAWIDRSDDERWVFNFGPDGDLIAVDLDPIYPEEHMEEVFSDLADAGI